jgi:hypothetical protein
MVAMAGPGLRRRFSQAKCGMFAILERMMIIGEL